MLTPFKKFVWDNEQEAFILVDSNNNNDADQGFYKNDYFKIKIRPQMVVLWFPLRLMFSNPPACDWIRGRWLHCFLKLLLLFFDV